MNRNLAIKILVLMITAIIIAWFIKPDHSRITKENTKIINLQKDLIETQKDLKESLSNQVEHVKLLNEAFDKTVEIERPGMQEWRNEITVEGAE